MVGGHRPSASATSASGRGARYWPVRAILAPVRRAASRPRRQIAVVQGLDPLQVRLQRRSRSGSGTNRSFPPFPLRTTIKRFPRSRSPARNRMHAISRIPVPSISHPQSTPGVLSARWSDGRFRVGARRSSTSPSRSPCRPDINPDRRRAVARRRQFGETAKRLVWPGPTPAEGSL